MVIVIVFLALIVGVIVGAVLLYNRLVSLRNRVDEAWAQISVQLKRRHDLIPPLVNTVKGYASHESKTLEAVVAARNTAVNASTPSAAGQAEGQLGAALGRLFALSENYPDLKASENFQQLQQELVSTEDRIAFARQYYNDVTRRWNTAIQTIPYNFLAPAMGARKRDYFEILDIDGTRIIETMNAEETIKPPDVQF